MVFINLVLPFWMDW